MGLMAYYGIDGKPHIHDPIRGSFLEKQITDDMAVLFPRLFFNNYLFRPHDIGDTFEAFGINWLIIEHRSVLTDAWFAMPESVHAHHTLMFRLEHYTALELFYISTQHMADPRDTYGLYSLIECSI